MRRGFELLVAKFKGKLTRDLMATENVVNVVRMIKVSPIHLTYVTKIRRLQSYTKNTLIALLHSLATGRQLGDMFKDARGLV